MGVLKVSLLILLAVLIVEGKDYRKLFSKQRTSRRNPFTRQLAKADACDPNPCKNDGYCCSDERCQSDDQPFECYCQPSYSGPTCDKVCGITKCQDKLWDDLYKFYQPPATSASNRSLDALNNLRRGLNDDYEQFCLPVAARYEQCIAEVSASGSHCGCDEQSYYSLLEPMTSNSICGGASVKAKCADDVDSCVALSEDIWGYLYTQVWGSEFGSYPSIGYGSHESAYMYGKQKRAANQVNEDNVEDKINEFQQCAQAVDVNAAAKAGCNVNALMHPLVEVAFMRAELDGCNPYTVDCEYPDMWTDPCDPARKTETEAFIACFKAAQTDGTCDRFVTAEDAFQQRFNDDIDENCASTMKFDALKDACKAPAARRSGANKASMFMRRLAKTLQEKRAKLNN